MNHKILVCYKSVTGFTKRYAEEIANKVDGTLLNFKDVTFETLSQYDIIVFGSRFHAGTVDGLKKIKKLIAKSNKKTFILFATGATPSTAEKTIQQAWANNLTVNELYQIPHFYMPGGLCYEKMPLFEKIMMKTFVTIMKHKLKNKKNKTKEDREFERVISTSYNISSKKYTKPLIALLKEEY